MKTLRELAGQDPAKCLNGQAVKTPFCKKEIHTKAHFLQVAFSSAFPRCFKVKNTLPQHNMCPRIWGLHLRHLNHHTTTKRVSSICSHLRRGCGNSPLLRLTKENVFPSHLREKHHCAFIQKKALMPSFKTLLSLSLAVRFCMPLYDLWSITINLLIQTESSLCLPPPLILGPG